eukprot:COSAG01_NODE_379_length_17872_cov_8.030102_15_plen_65_part_00
MILHNDDGGGLSHCDTMMSAACSHECGTYPSPSPIINEMKFIVVLLRHLKRAWIAYPKPIQHQH